MTWVKIYLFSDSHHLNHVLSFSVKRSFRPSHCPSTRGPLCQQYFPLICFVCSLFTHSLQLECETCLYTLFLIHVVVFYFSRWTHQRTYHRWYMSSTIIHTRDIHELSSALLLLYEVSKCEQLEISHFFSPLLLRLCADHPSQLKNPVAWHSNYHTGKILIVGNQRTPRKKESYRPAAISSEHSWREEKISAVHALQILSFFISSLVVTNWI